MTGPSGLGGFGTLYGALAREMLGR